jgi:hypothetical protein
MNDHQKANLGLFKNLKDWGLESFINYGGRLGFFEDRKDAVKSIKENMIPTLTQFEKHEDVEWLEKELEKYIAG